MDADVNALIGSVRAGAGRLAADLTAVEAGMAELYGAASGGEDAAVEIPAAGAPAAAAQPQAAPEPIQPLVEEPQPQPATGPFEAALDTALAASPTQAPMGTEPEAGGAGADVDGARLIALNMALNGESRSDTERYLAENFEIPDRLKLIDEVYAAIEG
jgi:hypothetical protein